MAIKVATAEANLAAKLPTHKNEVKKGDEIRASEKTKKILTSDLQRLVDEGSLSMEEALEMQGGDIAKNTSGDEANENR